MLFTDIEGSTALLQRIGERYRDLLVEHRSLIRTAVSRYAGTEVGTEGDSFFVLFETAANAVAAAVQAQRALGTLDGAEGEELRVRMGIHVGEVRFIGDDPVGLPVHHASRVMSAAHGGQILVSGSVRTLCDPAPDGIAFRDLGEHRLKDLQESQQLWQVMHADLETEFPPPRTLDARRNNLPVELTSFVGRARVLVEVTDLLERTRLVTLTGAGGIGKTRLALQVAADALDAYTGGVWLVDLAPVTDPLLIPATVAGVLGIRSEPGKPPDDALLDHLRGRTTLLILDNCEHLIDAASSIADRILRACPQVRIVATSREPLRLDGETAVRVPSLGVEDDDEALRLFTERAIVAEPSFVMTDDVADDVRRICRRLDGIPLAIELAAARVRAMPPRQIAERVEDRFRLLTGGSRTAMARQRTLRATVDWSYDLLDDDERTLLRRLSVFAGGFTLTEAEAVCGADLDVVDPLLRLVDRSLVLVEQRHSDARYRMLETIRQYASEKLADAGESAPMRDRHAGWVVRMAIDAEALLEGPEQRAWLDRMEESLDNVRAALQWRSDAHDGAVDAGEIAASLWRLWWVRGLWSEGIRWLESAYERIADRSLLHGRVAWSLGFLHDFIASWRRASELAAEALEIAIEVQDRRLECYARFLVAFAGERDYKPEQLEAVTATLTLARELGDPQMTAWCLLVLGSGEMRTDATSAEARFEEARRIAIAAGDDWSHGMALNDLASLAALTGDRERAHELAQQSVALRRALRDAYGIAQSTYNLALTDYHSGDLVLARQGLDEAERLHEELGDGRGVALIRVVLAIVDLLEGELERGEQRVALAKARVEHEEPGRTLALAWVVQGWFLHARGDLGAARAAILRGQEIFAGIDDLADVIEAELTLAMLDADSGDTVGAEDRLRTIIDGKSDGSDELDAISVGETSAYVASRTGRRREAAVLLGAVAAERARSGMRIPSFPSICTLARTLEVEEPDAWAEGLTQEDLLSLLRTTIR